MGRPHALTRWQRFWRSLLSWLVALTAIPGAAAQDAGPDHVQTCYPANGVSISAGCADWYVYWPTNYHGPGTYQIAVTASTSSAPASGTLSITAPSSSQVLTGCTLGPFTSMGTGRSATATIPLTATSEDCFASFLLQLHAGSTNLGGPQLSKDFTSKGLEESLLRVLADFAWVIWLAFVALTRFIPIRPLRLAVGLAGYGVLALPLQPSSFLVLATLHSCVVIFDVIQVMRPR